MTYDRSYHYSKIREMRDSYGADLVGMLVSGKGSSCGCGSLPRFLSSYMQRYAYFVSTTACAIDNLTFPHEVAHAFVSQIYVYIMSGLGYICYLFFISF
jgi:hypothetical protein